ncbi:O(6)-methylguanine-induced apoptosis 2 isoform X4 [Anas acuta]|uniref:O(6)-methylguanine-induced apoptosis 2 isoform X4 n=1 Tax=Anas acuta TaxID=28680 RepID=UPI0035C9147B
MGGRSGGARGFQISSSPYKHHGKVISDSEKNGFNSQSKRFQYNQSENPGPGFYDVTHQSPEINSPSLSKKGTGYFPSLTSTDFCKQSNNVSAHAVFVSRTTRGLNLEKIGKWPSPCHYNINDSFTKVSPKGITSCFKSKTSHLTRTDRITAEPTIYQPYKPTREAKKTPFKQKFCLTLCAPAIPPCKDPPFPGPGQYNLVDYGGSLKQNCSSAVFVSNTERWMGGGSQEGFPGPGAYSPRALGKYSFIYNYDQKWVPVL